MTHPLRSTDHPISPDGPRRPRLLIFDVNETLSDMSPLRARFADLGVPEHLATTWFAGLLRDGFALTAAGATAPFADIAAESLRVLFAAHHTDRPLEDAVTHVMNGFSSLAVHPDVPDGLRALADLDIRLVTLSNGAASIADHLLEAAGVRDLVERVLSVEDAGVWKPAPESYAYALAQCAVDPEDAMLVAVHPWDTDGATRAGLASAWINRDHSHYPGYFLSPTLEAASLTDLADQLH